MRGKRPTSRREFLRNCIAGTLSLSSAQDLFSSNPSRPLLFPVKSRVVIARDPLLRGLWLAKIPSGRFLFV